MNPADLRTQIATLTHGDTVRVEFSHRPPVTGRLRRSTSSVFARVAPNLLFLDVYGTPIVRDDNGGPGSCITSITPFDEDAWFDLCAELAQDYAQKVHEAEHCPKSEQGWRAKDADEAKTAFVAECQRGVSG